MASLDKVFNVVSAKFKIKEFNEHQKLAVRKIVEKKQDVFINLPTGYGKSLIFQALPLIFNYHLDLSGSIVVVVSPLLNLIKDQVRYLNSLDINAISISDIESEDERLEVERGKYSVVYGTPEAWLQNERWRTMLNNDVFSRKLCALAIDEAHVIKHWGISSNKKLCAFRECYSRLHELRTLAPKVNMVALTATATASTRDTIFDVLTMKEPYVIFESPNKDNISYSVHYMPKDMDIEYYFGWLAEELKVKKEQCERTIIYCQTIKQCGIIYATLKGLIGRDIADAEFMLEMLHSCTPLANKEFIMKSFSEESGKVRLLVATIAFGMGIDCKAVRRVIHFGPAKNIESYAQETGRAGRDGGQATALLLYNGMMLNHVEGNIKMYVNNKECRRKTLMKHFQAEFKYPSLPHLCCDNCAKQCNCGLADCGENTNYPSEKSENPPLRTSSRYVSLKDRNQIQKELNTYHKHLLANLLSITAQCDLKVLTNMAFVLGFSDIQIQQVLDNVEHMFTIDDICNSVEIWDKTHAYKVLQVINDVFQDIGECNWSDIDAADKEIFDDLCFGEWNNLVDDDEMLNMAADNILHKETFNEIEISEANDSLDELEISEANDELEISEVNDSLDAGIPDVIHETLEKMNISHD